MSDTPSGPLVVFITGASSGIGAACAKRFSADGARVVLTGRRKERLEALQAGLSAPSLVRVLDVRDRGAVAACLKGLPGDFSAIDVLVNNAGLALGLTLAQEARLDDWEEMVDTNIKGVLYMTQGVLPGMVARNRGHIINMGSVAGSYPYPGGNVYGATKAFVEQFSLNLKADLLGTQVRVTNVEPGMVETGFSLVRMGGDEARARAVYAGLKPMSAEDIAEVVHFCARQPVHLNVNRIEVMATAQAFAPFAVHRRSQGEG